MNILWTKKEDDTLETMRREGKQVPEIAAAVGRKIPATYNRLRKLNVIMQPHEFWSDADEAKLRAMANDSPPPTDAIMAAALGRTVQSLRWKLSDLKLTHVRDVSEILRNSARYAAAQARSLEVRKANKLLRAQTPVRIRSPKLAIVNDSSSTVLPATPYAPAVATNDREIVRAALVARRNELSQAAVLTRRVEKARLKSIEKEARNLKLEREAAALKIQRAKALDEANAALSQARAIAIAAAAQRKSDRAAELAKTRQDKKDAIVRKRLQRAQEMVALRVNASLQKENARMLAMRKRQTARNLAAVAKAARVVKSAPVVLLTLAPLVPKDANALARPAVNERHALSFRRGNAKKAPTREETLALNAAAKDAVANFIKERGITKPVLTEDEKAIIRLRRRGYIVLSNDRGYVIDGRHFVTSGPALARFAEQRAHI